MSLEVELLHRIESLERRVTECEGHHHDGDYHEHLLDEEEVKSIVESHLEKAADEIEAEIKKEQDAGSKEEESPESEPAGQESSSSESEEKEEEPEKQREETPPKREHFLHRKVGGKSSH